MKNSFVFPEFSPASLRYVARALDDWKNKGAQFVSLPWLASANSMEATRPADRAQELDVHTPYGFFVASGEQSFTDLATLPLHCLYIGWTPCLRHEPVFDDLHHYVFLKAELYWGCEEEDQARQHMLDLLEDAQSLFAKWLLEDVGHEVTVEQVMQKDGSMDLCALGVELGSYGVRRHPLLPGWYVYATALAEPRYGYVVSLAQQVKR